MTDHVMRDGDALHLAAPGDLELAPTHDDLLTSRCFPSLTTRCQVPTNAMIEISRAAIMFAERDGRTYGWYHVDKPAAILCSNCERFSRERHERQVVTPAITEARRTWRP